MATMTRGLAGAFILALSLPSPGQDAGQAERVYVEEVRRDVLKEIDSLVEAKDWRRLFDHYAHALQRFGNHVVSTGPDRWTSVREHLLGRFAALPKEAFEAYRFSKDGPARAAFEKARESGRRAALERAVEEYFFSSGADEILDLLARQAFDEGRPSEAAVHWGRLLRHHPDEDFPRAATAARLALALRAAGSEGELAALRAWTEAKGISGRVCYAGKETELSEILSGPVARRGTVEAPVDPAAIPRNDVRRWALEFESKAAPEETARGAQPGIVVLGRGGFPANPQSPASLAPGEFPYTASSGRARGRDLLVHGDGTSVTALDPSKVRAGSETAGICWRYPEDRPLSRAVPANPNPQMVAPRAPVGVVVDGDQVFVPMFSRLEVRPRDGLPQDGFDGPTSIKCLQLSTGRLIWDTDSRENLEELRLAGGKYSEKNFAYGAPLVRGDRLFVPVSTSPFGEQESYVVCLDRRTGRPLWATFLASMNSMQGAFQWNVGRLNLSQTQLAEHEGQLFVQTNLGASAGLDPATGTIRWLARYRRAGRRVNFNGPQEAAFHRPAAPPVAWNGRIYVLAQDRAELMCFEAATGKTVDLGVLRTSKGPYEWSSATYLLGPIEDSVVLAGSPESYILRLKSFTAATLSVSNTRASGRGVLHGGLLFLPVSGVDKGPAGSLSIFNAKTWKYLGDTPWREPGDGGHLQVVGEHLAASGRRLSVYASLARIRGEFSPRLEARPPQPEAFLEFGDLMRENARLEEAAEAYLGFVRAAEGDPRHDARVRQVKTDLFAIFLKRGEEALGRGDASKAAEAYGFARKFAWEERGEVEVLSRLARALEKLDRMGEAVEAHQEILDRPVPLFFREGERLVRAAEASSARIRDLAAKRPDAYAGVAARAAERLAAASTPEEWREVLERYPHSPAAREAFERLRAARAAAGDWAGAAALAAEWTERFGDEPGRALLESWAEAADRAGDRAAFERALVALERRFGDEKAAGPDSAETVKDLVARRRKDRAWPEPAAPSYAGRLQKGATLASDTGLPLHPLRPAGEVPSLLGPDLELFSSGSSVELWDVAAGRRLKAWPKPGAWPGVMLEEGPSGLRVASMTTGSPAERSGLRVGDVLAGAGGRPVSRRAFEELLAASTPGRKVHAAVLRDGAELRIELETGERPAEDGEPPVAAAFTRDGGLAVAWEDAVALFELPGGRVRWTFLTGRPRFKIVSLQPAGAALLAVEAADRDQRQREPWAPEEAHQRLHAISAATGAALWGRVLDFDPQQAALDASLTFAGRTGDLVCFVQKTGRAGAVPDFALWAVPETGKIERRPMPGNVLAHAWEPGRGILHYVADQPERGGRALRSLDPRTGAETNRAIGADRLMPARFPTATMVATPSWVAVVLPPSQLGGEARALAWTLPGYEERVLEFPEGRTMAMNAPLGAAPGPSGELLVYTQNRERRGEGETRAYLAAFRPAAGTAPAWDAPAPFVTGSILNAGLRLESGPGGHVVLTLRRGGIPGLSTESPAAAVYECGAEGTLRLRSNGAAPRGAGDLDPAAAWRGRIYVRTPQGLDAYRE